MNARGRLVREGAASASLPPTPGNPITTTIDLDLQRFIDSIWPAGVRGAMVALTPKGEVRALYSAPTFDPNHFVGGISSAEWRKLNTDPARPLLNRVMQARYPPASPFKLAIAAMALKRGLIKLSTRMPEPCRGGLRLGNRVFRGVNVGTTNSLPMAELHAMLAKVGCTDVQTYVQSGNAVFGTKLSEAALTKAIEHQSSLQGDRSLEHPSQGSAVRISREGEVQGCDPIE